MKSFTTALTGAALAGAALGEATIAKRAESCNTATNRTCWTTDGFDISTNYMETSPTTNVTRKFVLVVEEVEDSSADGYTKPLAMVINGTFPGPTLEADWGDEVEITMINNLSNNGTSMHWHGIQLKNNNIMDGVNGITECPTPPGYNHTYKFKLEQYGTTWYHSHFSTQYGNGAAGAFIINGPASANYDIDLGPYTIGDYFYKTAEEIYSEYIIPSPGVGPSPDNILFNGTAVSSYGGEYAVTTLTSGKTHRLRLLNPSVDSEMIVSLNSHNLTVISTDLVPVQPYTVDSLFLGIGQRYDVLITADQAVDNYWFNVTWPSSGLCGSAEVDYPAAIFRYEGADDAYPTDVGTAPTDQSCDDIIDFEPVVSITVPSTNFTSQADSQDMSITTETRTWQDVDDRVYWTVSASDMNITWGYPTLAYLRDNVTDYPSRLNAYEVDDSQEWSYWVINNELGVPHPIHLHGHDFYVLGSSGTVDSETTFNSTSDFDSLNFSNPTRRDVTMLPGYGWLVIAFETNNPGAWVMHCHIAWHVGSGLSVQFLESMSTVKEQFDLDSVLEPLCSEWNAYNEDATYHQEDSGL